MVGDKSLVRPSQCRGEIWSDNVKGSWTSMQQNALSLKPCARLPSFRPKDRRDWNVNGDFSCGNATIREVYRPNRRQPTLHVDAVEVKPELACALRPLTAFLQFEEVAHRAIRPLARKWRTS